MITLFSRAKSKIGFGLFSVREKPSILATHIRFEIPRNLNIRSQHLKLLQTYFQDRNPIDSRGVRFNIDPSEQEKVEKILNQIPALFRVMVCPGSKWSTKQLPKETLALFLEKIALRLNASFYFVWGSSEEEAYCQEVRKKLTATSDLVEKLPLTTWQNLMDRMDLVIAVDSSALHLCGTTQTPSFSLFGPTNPDIFKPIGPRHFALQGKCPYGRQFDKTCPILRTCSTGACTRDLDPEIMFSEFSKWWDALYRS